ncbi:MAG: PHP domain-containing protein, partial [Clostridia bacterium]|nr:PHP domain-containing protein [Clostridia bacterium]
MPGKRSLSSLFDRYNAVGYEKNLLDSATLVGDMRWDPRLRIFEVTADIPFVVPKDKLYLLEFNMAKAYDVKTIHIMPKYAAELFTQSYFDDVMKEAYRRDIISQSFLGRYKAVFADDRISVHTGFGEGGVLLLLDSNADKKISNIIFEEFGLRYTVEIVNDTTVDTGIRVNIEQRIAEAKNRASQSLAQETPGSAIAMPSVYTDNPPITTDGNGIYHIGYMMFDLSDSERIAGQDFEIVAPRRLHDMVAAENNVILVGVVTDFEIKQRRRGKEPIWFCINDGNASMSVRFAQSPAENEDYKNISDGMSVAIWGDLRRDDFDNELVLVPRGVRLVKQVRRADTASEKRVELHLHTTMSAMDGIIPPAQAVNTALAWGHKAIALTDHGNVQGYMAAAVAAKGKDIKLIYGMEGYFVDDTDKAVFGVDDIEYSDEFVVFDIETTGLSAEFCKITEIGAVRVKDGEVLETFETFVNPQIPIPSNIVELTGITDEMVADAPTADVAVADFLKFIGDDVIVAHNATFDISFIRKAADDYGYKFTNAFLDTLAISRFINPDLKKHKLDILSDYFNLGDFGHHRAYNDAEMTSKIMYCMFDKLRKEGVGNASSMIHAMQEKSDPLKLKPFHQILIAKNKTGLKNLYKIVSN